MLLLLRLLSEAPSLSNKSNLEEGANTRARKYKYLAELPVCWQEILQKARGDFHDSIIREDGFPLRIGVLSKLESFILQRAAEYEEEEGGIIEESE